VKPNVFIGSSTENNMNALALQNGLWTHAQVKVWNQGVFKMNRGYLESLLNELAESDFGVFVFSPDDLLKIRGKDYTAVRDNVLFELGLFMGKLGRDRAFFVVPANEKGLRLPSDLLGVASISFETNTESIEAAMGPACFELIKAIQKHGIRQDRLVQPSVETYSKPSILCACSRGFHQLDFDDDVALIRTKMEKIGAEMTEVHDATLPKLEKCLNKKFDVVHFAAYVDPRSGAVHLGDADEHGVVPAGGKADVLPAEGFFKFIELTEAKLVILATCDSLVLAAKLARLTNMIAATNRINTECMLSWVESIYECLSKGVSLSNAFETASAFHRAPMLLLLKKDLAFTG
jgi:Predicted nucleotide-binding protein containing TIR -like domain